MIYMDDDNYLTKADITNMLRDLNDGGEGGVKRLDSSLNY